MKIDGNEIKVGNILEIDGRLWRVLKTQHTQPGKGGAYIQAELKELKEGTKMTFLLLLFTISTLYSPSKPLNTNISLPILTLMTFIR